MFKPRLLVWVFSTFFLSINALNAETVDSEKFFDWDYSGEIGLPLTNNGKMSGNSDISSVMVLDMKEKRSRRGCYNISKHMGESRRISIVLNGLIQDSECAFRPNNVGYLRRPYACGEHNPKRLPIQLSFIQKNAGGHQEKRRSSNRGSNGDTFFRLKRTKNWYGEDEQGEPKLLSNSLNKGFRGFAREVEKLHQSRDGENTSEKRAELRDLLGDRQFHGTTVDPREHQKLANLLHSWRNRNYRRNTIPKSRKIFKSELDGFEESSETPSVLVLNHAFHPHYGSNDEPVAIEELDSSDWIVSTTVKSDADIALLRVRYLDRTREWRFHLKPELACGPIS